MVLATAAPAQAWLVPAIPAPMWRSEGYGKLVDMVVGENVTQVNSLGSAFALAAPPGSIVMYDLEPGLSPATELATPKKSLGTFVSYAHRQGWLTILAPSRAVANRFRRPHESENDAFLRMRIAGVPTDYFLLQAQHLECHAARYAAFVASAAVQIQGELIAELTVGWSDPCMSVATVIAAYDAARPYANHFALWGARIDAAPFWDHVLAAPG